MNRDYREIQLSPTFLVFIILGILIMGTVIFFLGVQVGKKQAELVAQTTLSPKIEEKVTSPVPTPVKEENESNQVSPAISGTSTEPLANQTSAPEQKPSEEKRAQLPPTSTSPPKTSTPEANPSTKPASRSSNKTAAPPEQVASGNYFIQVGALNDLSSAKLMADRFKKQGYRVLIREPFPRDKKPLYRLWLGGYQTKEEAQKALNELVKKSTRNPGYFIVHK